MSRSALTLARAALSQIIPTLPGYREQHAQAMAAIDAALAHPCPDQGACEAAQICQAAAERLTDPAPVAPSPVEPVATLPWPVVVAFPGGASDEYGQWVDIAASPDVNEKNITRFYLAAAALVPLTPDALADKCEAWIQGGGASNIVDAFEAGYRACEAAGQEGGAA